MGKVIVVTGSSRGIGKGLAREFAIRGASVVINGRSQAPIDETVAEIAGLPGVSPGQVSSITCDVTDMAQVQALWDHAVETFGRVDIWINNAGLTTTPLSIEQLDADAIGRVIATNLTGTLNGVRVAAAGMKDQPTKGFIYNVEGLGSKGETQKGLTPYGTTKAGVGYLMKALKKDLKGTGVHIGAIRPGINITEHLLTDAEALDPEYWERSKKIMNILGDKVETTTPWLADQILANEANGKRIAWLSNGKIAWRFASAGFNKRDLFAEFEKA